MSFKSAEEFQLEATQPTARDREAGAVMEWCKVNVEVVKCVP